MTPTVSKGFVRTAYGEMHFRRAGDGAPIVLLHDSPRSSAMHVALMRELAGRFSVFALDTPGYGLSQALPDEPRAEIPDFARALAATLEALGIERCPVYGFHTSSKINLQFAIDHPARVSLAIIDGLNLPPGGPSEDFIRQYMKPFVLSEDGSHFAASWAKARDFFRFFPWFDQSPTSRLPLDFPDDAYLHGYTLDMLMAGKHWTSAYSAAMRYLALPRVRDVRARTVFMCRETDPLYVYLDALPRDLPEGCSIERLPGDQGVWKRRLVELFDAGTQGLAAAPPAPTLDSRAGANARGYARAGSGQIYVEFFGARIGRDDAPPIVLLPETPGSVADLRPLAHELASTRRVYLLELPGVGESDALEVPDVAGYADALRAALADLGALGCDLVAGFLSSSLALELARRHPGSARHLVLDGVLVAGVAERRRLWKQYCPPLAPRADGSHYLSLWLRLRDRELCWPWYDRSKAAIRRRTADLRGERLHESTLALAKQLATHGDAAKAAIELDARSLLGELSVPVALRIDREDPRDAPVARLGASALSRVRRVQREAGGAQILQLLGQ